MQILRKLEQNADVRTVFTKQSIYNLFLLFFLYKNIQNYRVVVKKSEIC